MTLSTSHSYHHHLALAFQGVATTPEQLEYSTRIVQAPIAVIDFQGWQLTSELGHLSAELVRKRWNALLPVLLERLGPDGFLLIEDWSRMRQWMAGQDGILTQFVVQALQQGCVASVYASCQEDAQELLDAWPRTLVLHRRVPQAS